MSTRIRKVISEIGAGNVFTINDIASRLSNKMTKNTIAKALSRMYQSGEIQKVVDSKKTMVYKEYYVPTTMFQREVHLTSSDSITLKYIKSGTKIYGIYTGSKLLNKWGLSEQISTKSVVISNNTQSHSYKDEKLEVTIRKSDFTITNRNYQISELMEILKLYKKAVTSMTIDEIFNEIWQYIYAKFNEREKIEIFHYLYEYASPESIKSLETLSVYFPQNLMDIMDIYRKERVK